MLLHHQHPTTSIVDSGLKPLDSQADREVASSAQGHRHLQARGSGLWFWDLGLYKGLGFAGSSGRTGLG